MARWSALSRLWLVLALAVPALLETQAPGGRALAASPNGSARGPAEWHVLETANFRILRFGTRPVSQKTADACENVRAQLAGQWLADEPGDWSPKCDLVLHPTDESYLREVGGGGRNTLASSLVDRRRGRICLRRIDMRATRSDWQTRALGHEVAHVVLADRFVSGALPRWADEGLAILADPREKRERHQTDLKRAVARGAQFRLAELLALADYPPADRWATFYSQSASLVEYLVEQQGHGRFVEFVEQSLELGYDSALRDVYGVGIAELERKWHRQLMTPPAASVNASQRPAEPLVSESAG